MKISAKLLVITFTVVVSISGISALIYYSLTNSLLESQYSKLILNSTSDFANQLQQIVGGIDEEAGTLINANITAGKDLKGYETDFFFKIENDSLIDFSSFRIKDSVYLNKSSRSIRTFVRQNNNIILRALPGKEGSTFFYGKVITESFLNKLSEKIRAEIALVINNNFFEVSHSYKNGLLINVITRASQELRLKNNFDLHKEYLEESDFIASIYNSKVLSVADSKITFIIYNNTTESLQFRSTIKTVLIIVISSGIALTLILILLFTTKIRKQIFLLNQSAEITAKGDLEHRVEVISKDEIGKFGITFNKMLDVLKVIKDAEREYLEFLTLLNQNPSIKEISEAVLTKIIKGTGLTFGVVYMIEKESMTIISSHGINKDLVQPVQSANFYSKAIAEKDKIEFVFTDNYPEVRTGLAYIKIKYLLIFPIIYNKEVIAIIEVASETVPKMNVKNYLDNIHDQLAIGMINAKSLSQLENYIDELKTLNEEYQKQNVQIKGQNEKLIELHNQLKEKAEELEEKRNQAVQLTKVKSQFLANMSHELKTPLISIIGLTEVTIKEQISDPKIKERFNIVYRNGKKLLNMINNILEFSKFESGNVEVKNDVFLLNGLMSEVKEIISPLTKEKGLLFSIRNLQSEALISTDKVLLERVLLNLLYNAVKFTEKGNIELTISLTSKGDVEFVVSDTGIGITEEHQKIIFEEFKQAEEGSTKTYGGAGLGLAISKRYVEMLGGKISVKSKPKGGSKFKVILPKIIVEVIEDIPGESSEILVADNKRNNRAVLLVSKSDITRKLIQDYLANYNIMLAHQPRIESLQKTNPLNYDALFIDIDAVSNNIWDELKNIKQKKHNMPVIVMRMIEEEKVGFGLAVDDYYIGGVDESVIKSIIGTLHKNKKIKNLCIVRNNGIEQKDTAGDIAGVVYYNYSSWEKFNSYLTANSFDAVIVEMFEPHENSIEVIYKLRTFRTSKNIFVAFALPGGIEDDKARILYDEINQVTLKARFHPMDVLKVVRDKLNLTGEDASLERETEIAAAPVIPEAVPAPLKKILIVDDDNDTLFTIGEIITGIGYEAAFANNGIECLSAIAKNIPDLILLDIMMPQMDGFETIKKIRGDESFKHIPVAALTAYEMLDNKEVIEKNGFNDLITKPIDSKSLAFKIEKLLMAKQ